MNIHFTYSQQLYKIKPFIQCTKWQYKIALLVQILKKIMKKKNKQQKDLYPERLKYVLDTNNLTGN